MNWLVVLSLIFFSLQPVRAEETYHPVVTQPVNANPRYQPYVINMGAEALKFLMGTWTYNGQNVRVIETWATNETGDTVGIRKRMLTSPGTKSSSEVYDFFVVNGGTIKMRRMDVNLQDVGTQTALATCQSDCTNKAAIVLSENSPAQTTVMKTNYVSPNDDELDLEIITNENGKQTKEVYSLKRTR